MRAFRSAFFALIAVGACACDAPDYGPLVGDNAPDFEVKTLQNAPLSLKDLREKQGKVVMLDFWATYCAPCRMLSPVLEDLYDKYHSKGLQAMAISSEAMTKVRQFEKNSPHRFPVYIDEMDVATMSYKVDGLPTVVIIGKDGRVLYQVTGYSQDVQKKLEDVLSKELS